METNSENKGHKATKRPKFITSTEPDPKDNIQYVEKEVTNTEGLTIQRFFTADGRHPYEKTKWVRKTLKIMGPDGKIKFERKDVECPAHWGETALKVTADKYMFGTREGSIEFEDSLKQTFNRIANFYAFKGWILGYFKTIEDAENLALELKDMLVFQKWAPNSPVWFNTGHWDQHYWGRPNLRSLFKNKGNTAYYARIIKDKITAIKAEHAYANPQASACFLTQMADSMESVDDMDGILQHVVTEGRIFGSGSGIGINLNMRSSFEPIAGKGRSSGPCNFNTGMDKFAGAIKSGGRTRRAARMTIMDSDHPDVFEFLKTKNTQENIAKIILREHNVITELKKIAKQKIIEGDPSEKIASSIVLAMPTPTDEIYSPHMDDILYGKTLSDQNSNHSISLVEDFWQAFENKINTATRWVTDPTHIQEIYDPNKLLQLMAESVYENGEPGVHNSDIINYYNPVKEHGRINTSNPCVTGDTLIATTNGWQPIENLVGTTPEIIATNNTIQKSTKVFPTGTKPVYLLTTKSGYQLKITEDHLVTTLEEGDIPVKNLTDKHTIQLQGAKFGTTEIDEDIAYLIGYALGNGCISNQKLTLSINKKDEKTTNKLLNIINNYKNNHKTNDNRQNKQHTIIDAKSSNHITISRAELTNILQKYSTLNKKSQNKQLTNEGLHLGQNSIREIITGYTDSDGTIANYGNKSKYISIESTSETILQQIQLLLLNFAIKSKIYRNRSTATTKILPNSKREPQEYPTKKLHSLRISKQSRIKFEHEFKLKNPEKKQKLQRLNQKTKTYKEPLTDKIKNITLIGEFPVFDLTEPVTSHFTANGILIHNCSEYLHLNDTSCNLASLNLYRFWDTNLERFDETAFIHAVQMAMVACDINIEAGGFPTPQIAIGTYKYRTTGIGYTNLGGLLMALGLPYDSNIGRYMAAQITNLLTAACWDMSLKLGRAMGSYPAYDETKKSLHEVIHVHAATTKLLNKLTQKAPEEIKQNLNEFIKKEIRIDKLPRTKNIGPHDIMEAFLRNFKNEEDISKHVIIEQTQNLQSATNKLWDYITNEIENGDAVFRNSFVSVIAPTGTISAPLGTYDEGTTSAEPDNGLVKYKQLSGGGSLVMFNTLALEGLKKLGYSKEQIQEAAFEVAGIRGLEALMPYEELINYLINTEATTDIAKIFKFVSNSTPLSVREFVNELKTKPFEDITNEEKLILNGREHMEKIPWLKDEHKTVFDCADSKGDGKRSISYTGHIHMLGALQPFLSGAISKTVNLPESASIDEIKECFIEARRAGVKCIAIFRNNSKANSVYYSDTPETRKMKAPYIWAKIVEDVEEKMKPIVIEASKPKQKRLPGRRSSQTIKFSIGGTLKGFVTIGIYPDGSCGEIFGRIGQVGNFASSMFEATCKNISALIQHGIHVKDIITENKGFAFEPSGFCYVGDDNDENRCEHIRSCASVIDLLAKILEWLFPAENDYKIIDLNNTGAIDFNEKLQEATKIQTNQPIVKIQNSGAAKICPSCLQPTYIQDGKCRVCTNCGFKEGGCGE